MRFYGYVRVSTVVQAEEGESLEVQQRKIEGRALELGKRFDRIFIERGVSGSKPLEKRPEGKELLRTVQSGDTILVSKLDRMFRSASDALRIIEALRKRKISLYLLDVGGDCTGDGIAKLVVTILSAVAEFERYRIRERVLEHIADRRKRGLRLGGVRPPFGFKVVTATRKNRAGDIVDESRLKPFPKEQGAIRLIKRLHAKKQSLREIAQRVRDLHGLHLSHMTVQAVLRREGIAKSRRPAVAD